MAQSQRRRSKLGLRQAIKYLNDAEDKIVISMAPYFERFPQKRLHTRALIDALETIKETVGGLLSDV